MRRLAIVGRPNVGKSALFNRLAGRRISIVHDQPGVTRDRITAICRAGPVPFEIIDTGGIGASPDPAFADDTHLAAEAAIASADVLLFTVDGLQGLTPLDQELAAKLRAAGRPVVLAINKIDTPGHENLSADFAGLGLPHGVAVSALHDRGIRELLDTAARLAGDAGDADAGATAGDAPRLAIVGRPNVGKSSLVNAVLGDRRTIVSPAAGTTRDAVDVPFTFRGEPFILCDTAGLRHPSRHDTSVEVFSAMRSTNAIRRADLCVLMVDAAEGVTTQDKRIAGHIHEAGRAAVIAINKWDLVRPEGEQRRDALRELTERTRAALFFLQYAPVVILAAKTGENVTRLLHAMEKVRQHATRRIGTGVLNRFLKDAFENQPPPMRRNRRFKLLYATQVAPSHPRPFAPPEFVIFGNDPALLTANYRAYLAACIRKKWEFPGLPLLLKFRGREARTGKD